jgi:cholesterol 7-dehydrogenase
MKGNYDIKRKKIGKVVPPYPNGWFIACKSDKLPLNASRAVDINGQNIVIARDKDGTAHALEAYCAHMGAHLGVGGQVVNGGCLECPFHGWLYNLETGKCVGISILM